MNGSIENRGVDRSYCQKVPLSDVHRFPLSSVPAWPLLSCSAFSSPTCWIIIITAPAVASFSIKNMLFVFCNYVICQTQFDSVLFSLVALNKSTNTCFRLGNEIKKKIKEICALLTLNVKLLSKLFLKFNAQQIKELGKPFVHHPLSLTSLKGQLTEL